jgi:DNA helicase-2/ATP-dependent DNA helicase PcrA
MVSTIPELSLSQRVIFDPAVRVLEAGPGAGKTRALSARFITEARESARGVAFMSFTNAAVNEVRPRTAHEPALRSPPHFAGTIDSFLHRFIVTPTSVAMSGHAPTYLSTWSDLSDHLQTEVRLREVPGAGIALRKFALADNIATLTSALNNKEQGYLEQVVDADRRPALLALAARRIHGYHAAGIFDAASARTYAYTALNGSAGPNLFRRLANRFHLVLVDEAQDCDEAEIDFFRRLGAHIRTVVVADPDQAIFEFRGGKPAAFTEFRDSHPEHSRGRLLENHRSTEAICKVVSSLRAHGHGEITAVKIGPCEPILLIGGTKDRVRAKFIQALRETGIAREEAIVLAHAGSMAAAVAGRPAPKETTAVSNRLAQAAFLLGQPGHTPKARLDAVKDAERTLLSLVDWPKEAGRTREQQLQLLDLSAPWLRVIAGTLLAELRGASTPDVFGRMARDRIGAAFRELPRPIRKLSACVKRPDKDVWDRCTAAQDASRLACEKIHQIKGREFPAVLVALHGMRTVDGRDVVDEWSDDVGSEARRVVYVAASRAEQLLAFGGTPKTVKRLEILFAQRDIPVRVL